MTVNNPNRTKKAELATAEHMLRVIRAKGKMFRRNEPDWKRKAVEETRRNIIINCCVTILEMQSPDWSLLRDLKVKSV